ncbi:MAG: TVP38/TMEM64 family protein [Nannocystales bacterium]
MNPDRARAKWLKFALGLLFLAAVLSVLFGGFYEDFDAAQVRAWLQASGIWGPIVFLLAFAILQPVGLSAHVFIIAASLVWPATLALPLSWAGATLAGCTAFGFARFVGYDWVQQRIPERLAGYDEALATKGVRTVLVLRLTFFTFGPMQLMLGVSKVRFGPYVLGTALGLLPFVAAETLIGASLVDWLFGRA